MNRDKKRYVPDSSLATTLRGTPSNSRYTIDDHLGIWVSSWLTPKPTRAERIRQENMSTPPANGSRCSSKNRLRFLVARDSPRLTRDNSPGYLIGSSW